MRWLDIHNLVGILLVMWTLVVGFTGVINTWADLVIKIWQYRPARGDDRAVPRPAAAGATRLPRRGGQGRRIAACPDMRPSFVAFPGTTFSSKSHYAVFMRGDTPITSRLLKPALIDAETGKLDRQPRHCPGTSRRC